MTSINSYKINNLNDLVEYFRSNCGLSDLYVEGFDFNLFNNKNGIEAISIDKQIKQNCEVFYFDYKTKEWISKEKFIIEFKCNSQSLKEEKFIPYENEKNYDHLNDPGIIGM